MESSTTSVAGVKMGASDAGEAIAAWGGFKYHSGLTLNKTQYWYRRAS